MANEFNEIQTHRKVKPVALLLSVLFFYVVAHADALTSTNPNPSSDYQESTHFLFRFAVASFLFITMAIAQYIWDAIYCRFVEDKMGQFTDLCSICNISVFILSDALSG